MIDLQKLLTHEDSLNMNVQYIYIFTFVLLVLFFRSTLLLGGLKYPQGISRLRDEIGTKFQRLPTKFNDGHSNGSTGGTARWQCCTIKRLQPEVEIPI